MYKIGNFTNNVQPSPNKLKHSNIIVLDGGTGFELEKQFKIAGVEVPKTFFGAWSAGLMLAGFDGNLDSSDSVTIHNVQGNKVPSGQELLTNVHLSYLRSGSTVITTNTYSVTPETAEKILHVKLETLIDIAVAAAFEARKRFLLEEKNRSSLFHQSKNGILIAASIPPLRASYLPEAVPDNETLEREYTQIVKCLLKSKNGLVDILQIETLTCVREAKICLDVCFREVRNYIENIGDADAETKENGKDNIPIWLGVTVYENGYLPSGETIEDLLEAIFLNKKETPATLNLNCSHPDDIETSLKRIRMFEENYKTYHKNMPNDKLINLGVYPNRMIQKVGRLKTEFIRKNDENGNPTTIEYNGNPEVYKQMKLWDIKECTKNHTSLENDDKICKDMDFKQRNPIKQMVSWIDKYKLKMIGGCCHFGPEHIRALVKEISDRQ